MIPVWRCSTGNLPIYICITRSIAYYLSLNASRLVLYSSLRSTLSDFLMVHKFPEFIWLLQIFQFFPWPCFSLNRVIVWATVRLVLTFSIVFIPVLAVWSLRRCICFLPDKAASSQFIINFPFQVLTQQQSSYPNNITRSSLYIILFIVFFCGVFIVFCFVFVFNSFVYIFSCFFDTFSLWCCWFLF